MPVYINFKMCDNCADCDAISKCPAKVFRWDDSEKTLVLDKHLCLECGQCSNFCSVNAIRFAKDAAEAKKVEQEIANDPRTVNDLFVDRYGAASVLAAFSYDYSARKLADRVNTKKGVIAEFNTLDGIRCLVKSIPVSDIQKAFGGECAYSKFWINENDKTELGITELPALKFYRNNRYQGQIEGYYSTDIDDKKEFFEQLEQLKKKG